ncbi:endolytic transglycosylase MltG [Acetivibrio sp. MSJd-27]|uniref:endolytic transglycosylase MltG n=1 Tax=Acetivibrio sp. MSJd-27 TaxID=2841523 RepID=UPI001C116149|nr:endolytic transglycosylase MltG [Acetivibrio sp. MSJd-27]MBU5450682.1 endolytic transglycosylase MltG [Acetivibrio sp. MSJd-27]
MLKKIIIGIVFVAVLVLGYSILEINTVFSAKSDVQITVAQGDNLNTIISDLKEQKVITNKFLFKLYSKFHGSIETIRPGIISIPKGADYKEIFGLISKPDSDEVAVTIPEGFELREIADKLEKEGLIDKNKFYDTVKNHSFDYEFLKGIPFGDNRLEGFLFPDTYTFSKTLDNETTILEKMLKRFEQIYSKSMTEKANQLSMTDYEVITLASVIEREARTTDDFYLVSSVFHNRLKRTDSLKYLQSCATVQYILKERKSVLSEKDTKIDSPYNTYRYPGLPAGPICSPGKAAIDAALNPKQTDYLYFLNDSDGKLHFSTTYAEHQKLMEQYGLK